MSAAFKAKPYFVPAPSAHPAAAAAGIFLLALGATQSINAAAWGAALLLAGFIVLFLVLARWFGEAIAESEKGWYGRQIDLSFRWSMGWFIFSEVMFFGALFSALLWARGYTLPELASAQNALLWPGFRPEWPTALPGSTGAPSGLVEPFRPMTPFWVPSINTALLLTSGVTLTAAHHALRAAQRTRAIGWLWATIALGAVFMLGQAYEYVHAWGDLNLKLSSGIYGSTFYLLTGFHGFHVMLGLVMFTAVTLRLHRGHFSPQRHFGFEGAAWYWHFVDVVWLALYVLVYWM